MKRVLIWLAVLLTLCQTDDNDKNIYERSGKITGDSLQDAENDFINKYLENKSARDGLDAEIAKNKAKTVARERKSENKLNDDNFLNEAVGLEKVVKDRLEPVLNVKRRADSEISNSASSSREFMNWKEEWQELWQKRKAETKNFSTHIDGDFVNMVAARPWGVSCGDPAQHDMPWGSCVLAVECNAEYRIYKGDYFCGRTQFVCCSLNLHTYDLYQGLDASFEQSSFEINSAEERERAKNDRKLQEFQKKSERKRKRRKRLREERKRKIKRTIAKIVKEVQKVLERAYRNGSKIRKKKTKTMKKFIKFLKKQYRLNRESAKDIHEQQMMEVDQAFLNKLMEVRELNNDFMTNDTFRNMIVNRTISLRTAKWLARSHPELEPYLPAAMYNIDYTRQRKESARRIGDYSRRGYSVRSRGYSARPRGSWAQQRGSWAQQRGHARIKGDNTRMRGGLMRPPNRRKHPDYDVEYGLMYS